MAAFERGKPGPTRAPPPRRPVPPTLSRSNSGQPPNRPPRNNSSEDVASAGSLPTRGKLLPPRRRPPVPRSATTEIDISSAPPPKPISTRILPPPRKNSPGATTPPCSPTGPPPRPNPFADAPPPKPAPVRVQSSSAIGRLTPPKPQQPGAPPRRNPSPRTQAPPPTIASAPPPKPVVSAPPPKPAVSAPPPKPVQVTPAAVIPPKIATNNVAPPSKPQYKSAAPLPGKPVGEPNNRPQSSFEKVTPSNRTNQQGNFSKISPQRGGPPERKRAPPPPVSSEPSRFTSNLGINKAVLESAKADSTVKGQLISAEKNFILMCTSGLETYANNNQNLSTYDKECLFANLDSIIKAHTDVLASVSDSSTASDLLLSLVPHLHLYLSYIANMSKAFETLSNLRERNVFLDVTQKDTLHAQTIEALLERPKQYLEAYPSAISTLMERVDPNCEEHGRLQQALQAFEYVQRQVEKRDVLPKHLTNSWDIVQSFDQSENLQLGDNRELYMEDYATLVESNDSSRKVGEKMRILVFKGLIILAASVNQYLWGSVIKGGLENIVVHEVDKWDNCLEFVHQNKSYTVNVDSKAKWMNYLPVQYPNGRKPLAFKLEF